MESKKNAEKSETKVNKGDDENQHIKAMMNDTIRTSGEFISKLSHELKTPLSAIMGISEIELKSSDLSPRIKDSFIKIFTSSSHILGIVNDIIDLSEIDIGNMEIIESEYEVAGMIVDMSYLYQSLVGDKDIFFTLDIDRSLPTFLFGDVLRIGQISKNALTNAFRYTERGTINLSVQGERSSLSDDEITLVITITDTGLGMTEDQIENFKKGIFSFRGQADYTIRGTGLGMAIVFNLARLMNATVTIDSEVGVGTKLVVKIPQKISSDEVIGEEFVESFAAFDESSKMAVRKLAINPTPMPYGKVLVVDDVSANLYVAERLLSLYSIHITTCTSGYEAIDLIQAGNTYDIIFMDHMMPGMNGVETMARLRDLGYSEPIVALTANQAIGQAEIFLKMGFDGFTSKPIRTKHFNTILEKYIKGKQPPEVLAAVELQSGGEIDKTIDVENFLLSSDIAGKLRHDFSRSYKDTFTKLTFSIDAGDLGTAHRIIHTIKGSAGLIGEKKLVEIALELEQNVKRGLKPSEDGLLVFEEELKNVLSTIGDPETYIHSEDEQLSKDEALNLLMEIEPLIAEQSIESLNVLEEVEKIPGAQELYNQLLDFDFDAAQISLEKLKGLLSAS